MAKFLAINTPTKISAGAVAHVGITPAIGLKNRHTAKQAAVTKLARPVLPPAAIPDADSTKVVHVDVPRIAPAAVPIESHIILLSKLIGSPFSSNIFACDAVPYKVPIVSNISTRQNATISMIPENTPPTYGLSNAFLHASALKHPRKPISPKSLKD